MDFLEPLRQRRIFRYVVAYCAAGWAALEAVDTLADNGILPGYAYIALFSLFLCGLPGALIVSWYHGAKGRQQMPALERGLLIGVAIFALATTGFVVRGDVVDHAPPGLGLSLQPHEDPRRIAVLYFETRGGAEAELLAPGLTESLIDELSGVSALHVVSRNGSQLFRDSPAPPDSIGRTLQAGTLVNGTVTQAGDRVRIDVSMVRSATGEQYARTRLERPRSEIFELQDALADTVAYFLRSHIGREIGDRTLRAGTRSVEAWEHVQAAEHEASGAVSLVADDDLEAADRAVARADSLLARAEAADPAWIEPVLRRGWLAYRRSRLGGMDRAAYEKWIGIGLEHAGRALAREPRNGKALELRGTLVYWMYLLNLVDPAGADSAFHLARNDFRAAIAAGGNTASAHNSLSHLLLNQGEVAEAKLNAREAYVRDPFLENANLTLWRIFTASWNLQDDVEARRYCDEGRRRFPQDFRFQQCALMLFALPGRTPDVASAWSLLEGFTRLSPPQVREVNHQRGRAWVAMALARANLPDSARSVLRDTEAPPAIDPLREVAWVSSIAYTWLGDPTEAVRQLSAYFAANPTALSEYRAQTDRRALPWYHAALMDEPAFRSLVGAH